MDRPAEITRRPILGVKHRVKQRPTGEESFKVTDGDVTEVGPGLRREDRDVMRQHHIVHGEELCRHLRLLLKDIQAGSGDPPFLERRDQLRLVDVRAPPDVYHDPVLPERRQHVLVHDVARLPGQRAGDDEHVRFRREVVDAREVPVGDGFLGLSGAVADDAAEACQPPRDQRADVAQADDAHALAAQLRTHQLKYQNIFFFLLSIDQEGTGPDRSRIPDLGAEGIVAVERPEPAADEPVGGGHAAEHVDEQADGVVGDVGGVDRAGAGDAHAAARALAEVDVVQPGPRAVDEAERRDGVQERGVHADGVAPHGHQRAGRVRAAGRRGQEGGERRARREEVEDAVPLAQRREEPQLSDAEHQERRQRRGLGGGCHGERRCGGELGFFAWDKI
jgi:hypothetical protein